MSPEMRVGQSKFNIVVIRNIFPIVAPSPSIAVSRIMLDLNFIVENSFVRLCGKIEILNGFRYYHCFHRLQIAYASFIRYAAIQCR